MYIFDIFAIMYQSKEEPVQMILLLGFSLLREMVVHGLSIRPFLRGSR